MHPVLPRQLPGRGTLRLIQREPSAARRNAAILKDALEGRQPAPRVLLELCPLIRGALPPRPNPVGVEQVASAFGEVLQCVNCVFEACDPIVIVLKAVRRELLVVADQEPTMASLERKGQIEAVRLAGLLDD